MAARPRSTRMSTDVFVCVLHRRKLISVKKRVACSGQTLMSDQTSKLQRLRTTSTQTGHRGTLIKTCSIEGNVSFQHLMIRRLWKKAWPVTLATQEYCTVHTAARLADMCSKNVATYNDSSWLISETGRDTMHLPRTVGGCFWTSPRGISTVNGDAVLPCKCRVGNEWLGPLSERESFPYYLWLLNFYDHGITHHKFDR